MPATYVRSPAHYMPSCAPPPGVIFGFTKLICNFAVEIISAVHESLVLEKWNV